MLPKPKHLGVEYAEQFKERSVVEAYSYRPPYPPDLFEILTDLIEAEPSAVLDIGCGTGLIARPLCHYVNRVDAVDFSRHMIESGRSLAGGNAANLNWIWGAVEDAPLSPPYALVTAGASLHWMAWEIVLPRMRKVLNPGGYLAIISNEPEPMAWESDLEEIIPRFSTNQEYEPYDLVEELESRGLFKKHGECWTDPMPVRQSLGEYVESWHSSNGLSRERMEPEAADAFDHEVRALVRRFCEDERFTTYFSAQVVWGLPTGPQTQADKLD